MSYLLLDRSEHHDFYSDEGPAEIKGYGKSRRSFVNIKSGYSHLKNNNIPNKPGKRGEDV